MRPVLKVPPADVGIQMRCPRDGERIHPVCVFENVRGEPAVLAARARHDAVIRAVGTAMLVAESAKFVFALFPIYLRLFPLGIAACVAHAVRSERYCFFFLVFRTFELHRASRALVRDYAARAEFHIERKAVHSGFHSYRETIRTKFSTMRSPSFPLFSGWNCVPNTASFLTTEAKV